MRCTTPLRAGDLGVAIKGMVDEFQAASKSNQNIQTIADMQRFVENYPEFRAKSGNVSKHVTLMGEMSRVIDERHLMQVSQVEQARLPRPGPRRHAFVAMQFVAAFDRDHRQPVAF
jgi:hypothetical protein